VAYVQSGMVVGLGAGSTAILATRRIGQLLREGRRRDIVGVPCSRAIEAEARSAWIRDWRWVHEVKPLTQRRGL